jgi:hypothetical protein
LHIANDSQCEQAIKLAEAFADEEITEEELIAACELSYRLFKSFDEQRWVEPGNATSHAQGAALRTAYRYLDLPSIVADCTVALDLLGPNSTEGSDIFLSNLVREVMGWPSFAPFFDSRWRTSDTIGLARGIYDERAFDRLPILADALMDAGCEDEQIIAHCRSEGPHVRGCWVVDLVLGKS